MEAGPGEGVTSTVTSRIRMKKKRNNGYDFQGCQDMTNITFPNLFMCAESIIL